MQGLNWIDFDGEAERGQVAILGEELFLVSGLSNYLDHERLVENEQ